MRLGIVQLSSNLENNIVITSVHVYMIVHDIHVCIHVVMYDAS